MSYLGKVKNGVVVLDEGTALAEGTCVRVEPLTEAPRPTLADTMRPYIGALQGLPSDFASQHDHYLHGQPKK